MAVPILGQDLTAVQQQKLDNAISALKSVDTNLKLAQSSAGPGTAKPKGSRAKLAKLRLDSAAAGLPEVKRWLADLPEANASVGSVKTNLDAAEKAIAALDSRLTGKAAVPKPPVQPPAGSATDPVESTTKPMTEAKPKTVKLGYQQVDVLKGAQFNLREVEGNVAALTKLIGEISPVKDQLSIDFRRVRQGLGTIENAQRKSGFVNDGLVQLPANGEGVAETVQRLKSAKSQINEAGKYLNPLNAKLTDLINPANYPEFRSDLKRLRELSAMYGNPLILQTNLSQSAAVLAQSDAATIELKRIAQAYARLIEQKTDEGKSIEGAGNYFLQSHSKFLAAAETEKQQLPQKIRAHLTEADKIAKEAVENKKPRFFTGGIPQVMGFAEEKVGLYKSLDPENAPALLKELENIQASIDQRAKSLESLIIQQNPLPNDRFTGGDRDKVVAVAVDAWKHQQAKFTVLASRIPSENWLRETMWQYSNGTWYFVDRSKLQVQLIVADEKDKTLAVILPINIWKNHQKGDSMIGTPLYSGDEERQPNAYMLRAKIK